MNANELADIVDHWAYKESAEYLTDAANMLRQQSDRIRNLEKSLGFKNSGYETIALTPPVAWMHSNPEYPISKHWSQEYNIPLYTHPVKELTEKVMSENCTCYKLGYNPLNDYRKVKAK